MKPERIPWLTRGESGTGIFAQKEKKAENIKEKRTAKTEPKTEEIVIPIQRKLWRLLKPLLTYELFLIGATVLLALILMTFTTGGYLEERMHATSVLASAIGSLAAIPVLWKQYKKMKACSRNRKTVECGRGSRLYSAGYDLRPSPEHCHERDRLYQNLFRLSGHGIKDL